MKQLLITIAALVLAGCGAKPNYSGFYTLDVDRLGTLVLELKPDSSFIGTPQGEEDDRGIGSWKVEGDLLVCEGTTEKSSKKIVLKLNKTTLELTSMTVDGKDRRPPVPEGADGNFFKKSAPSPKTEPVEPVAKAAKVEPSIAKAPDISFNLAAGLLGNIEAVKQHLAAGADVNAKDDDNGMNPLHDAAMYGRKEILELLISEGADVNAKDDARWTPLHYAGGSKEVAELLIANGADVNAKNDGAEWNAKNKDGDTPLDVMQAEGDLLDTSKDKASKKEVAELLRKHGGKTGEELKTEAQ